MELLVTRELRFNEAWSYGVAKTRIMKKELKKTGLHDINTGVIINHYKLIKI